MTMEKKVFVLQPKPRMRSWWYMCYVQANQERKFRHELAKVGVVNFSPVETVWLIKNRIKKKVERYLFGGYVFVHKDYLQKFKKRNEQTPWSGLFGIFTNCDNYSVVDDDIVSSLIKRQAAGEFDRTLSEPTSSICVGDKVYIKDLTNAVLWSERFGYVLELTRKNAVIAMGTATVKLPLGRLIKAGL